MYGCKIRVVIIVLTVLLLGLSATAAETWRLGSDQNWKQVGDQNRDKYLTAVARIKQLANTGQTDALKTAAEKLKKDFPQIAGPDMDAFIEAEILFSKGKFSKAIRRCDKFLTEYPESRLYEAVIDREFTIATAFLAGQKIRVFKIFKIRGYAEGAKIMEKISDRAGLAPVSLKASLAIVKSYEERKKFDEAYHKWSEIQSRWPTGRPGRDALLGMARCKHAAYKGPRYDSSDIVSAKSYYQNYRLRYPEHAAEIEVDKIIEQIEEQLAYKQFEVGKYYQQTQSPQAANLYYQMVTDNWPGTVAAKSVNQMAKNQTQGNEKDAK